jgi:phosphotransferase system HPr (HPr) family protein
MTVQATALIKNEAGIHCRPSTHILKTMQDCPAQVTIVKAGEGESDLSSMLSLMILGLTCGTEVLVEVSGTDEQIWCDKVVELLETEYDFPDAGGAG